MPIIGGSVAGYRLPTPYVGLGDLVFGATAYWGLRAYSAAAVGTNAIRIRRNSDNAEQDFVTVSGGALDWSGISAFVGAATPLVVKLYDQTGNGNVASQATAANQPALISNDIRGVGTSKVGVLGGGPWLDSTLTYSTPLTSFTALHWSATADNCWLGSVSSGGWQIDIAGGQQRSVKSLVSLIVGGTSTFTGAQDFTSGATYDGTNGALFRSGASDGTGTNAAGLSAVGVELFATNSGVSASMNGSMAEQVLWGSILNSTQISNLHTNSRSFWGF